MQTLNTPPQYQNKCYCQTRCEFNFKTKDGNFKKGKRFFVKVRSSNRTSSTDFQPNVDTLIKSKSQRGATASQPSPMEDVSQSFPNRFNTFSCNQVTNPISQNINQTSDLQRINTIQCSNFHSSTSTNNPNSKLFNEIYDRYEKLREIETFRAENANECRSVRNQQTNHHRVPNRLTMKHVCQHRYRYLMEPWPLKGRDESKCELCEKWCEFERLRNVVVSGNCCIVDKIDTSNLLIGDGIEDYKIILEVQNMNISSNLQNTTSIKPKKRTDMRSWYLMEQPKSLALNQQERN